VSAFARLISFVDRDAARWHGYPLMPVLIGLIPLAVWAFLSDRPPEEGPVWALVLATGFFVFWTALAVWRGFRFEWRELRRIQRLGALEEKEGER
jgi:hypothetical protein